MALTQEEMAVTPRALAGVRVVDFAWVEISGSNFPRFDRNQNTGAPIGQDDRLQVARQTVHHREDYPSHIVMPIIPR